jgi:SAM-dependent methyltransferase
MPIYKWIGNQVLTVLQNLILRSHLSEFHSGYRLYSTEALSRLPFEKNTSDFHFDTEIIIQLLLQKLRIVELPIPTFYGDEICHVQGLRYGWQALKASVTSQLCRINLLYDPKFDVQPAVSKYGPKLGFRSSHTMALAHAEAGQRILDLGCGEGHVAAELLRKGCRVTAVDREAKEKTGSDQLDFLAWDLNRDYLPVNVSAYDQVFLLDIVEHLKDPARLMETLRSAAGCKRPKVVLTTANIAFVVTRLMLLFGQFNYGKKGILDLTHTRLFTFGSVKALLEQSGYRLYEVAGIPAPFPQALGDNLLSRFLLALNSWLIRLSPRLFSYQIFVRAQALPTVDNLLAETISASTELSRNLLRRAA